MERIHPKITWVTEWTWHAGRTDRWTNVDKRTDVRSETITPPPPPPPPLRGYNCICMQQSNWNVKLILGVRFIQMLIYNWKFLSIAHPKIYSTLLSVLQGLLFKPGLTHRRGTIGIIIAIANNTGLYLHNQWMESFVIYLWTGAHHIHCKK